MKAEVDDWSARYAALVTGAEPPTGERAMDLAEEHRQHISAWFYDCPYTLHRGLAGMYVRDERFKAFSDSMAPGLAEHLKEAIEANAARHRV